MVSLPDIKRVLHVTSPPTSSTSSLLLRFFFQPHLFTSQYPKATSFLYKCSTALTSLALPLFVSLFPTDPVPCPGSVVLYLPRSPAQVFMQPEPPAVSQHTPFVDSHPAEPLNSIQHGPDLCGDDHRVSGSLPHGVAGDRSEVVPGSARDAGHSPLNGSVSVPSSPLVSGFSGYGYENEKASASSTFSASPLQQSELGFRVTDSSRRSPVPFEAFPNGGLS